MLKSETLYKNETFNVKEINLPEKETKYPFVETANSSGDSVAILPFRLKKGEAGDEAEFLVRREWVPCWGMYEDALKQPYFVMAAVSDVIPKGMGPTQAVTQVLKEQTGYDFPSAHIMELGGVFLHKNFSGMCYVYCVDVTNAEPGERTTQDKIKQMGETFWTDEKNMVQVGADPIIHVIFSKLLQMWT